MNVFYPNFHYYAVILCFCHYDHFVVHYGKRFFFFFACPSDIWRHVLDAGGDVLSIVCPCFVCVHGFSSHFHACCDVVVVV